MKSNPIPEPTFNRPLLDFTRALRLHQCSSIDHKQTFEILDKIAKELQVIQNAYELMPSNVAGQWFLRSSYDSVHRNIRERCARLKGEIDSVRPLLTQDPQQPNTRELDKFLNDLTCFLGTATNDPSCLATFVAILTPDEPAAAPAPSLVGLFQILEA
jgi:hypothetical protein